jgi:serine/threonine protein kinase
VVQLERVAVSNTAVFLVFEHCQHDLANLIDAQYKKLHRSPFSVAGTKRLLLQLLSALQFLHEDCGLIHRDMKLSNLLYTDQGRLKLADFGLSRRYCCGSSSHVVLTPNVASLWYRPPDLLLGAVGYGTDLDLWAAGCIFCEILKGYPLLAGATELDQIQKIFACLGVPTALEWPSFSELPLVRDGLIQELLSSTPRSRSSTLLDDFSFLGGTGLRLLTSLLQYDPEKRWSASRALESTYFKEEPLPTPVDRMPRFQM